jgi:hypothetical protein
MPKERRQDLVSSQGHSMTWKRYHRYKGSHNFSYIIEIQIIRIFI